MANLSRQFVVWINGGPIPNQSPIGIYHNLFNTHPAGAPPDRIMRVDPAPAGAEMMAQRRLVWKIWGSSSEYA